MMSQQTVDAHLGPDTPTEGSAAEAPANPWAAMVRATLARRSALIGGIVLVLFIVMAITSLFYTPYDPIRPADAARLAPPSLDHWFGTDQLGRDIFSRVMVGSRVTILVGFGAVTLAAVVGTALGVVSAYYGGKADGLIMRLMDIVLAFPGLLFALIVAAVMGPGIISVIIAVGFAGVPNFARVARGAALAIKDDEYVLSARATGCRDARILVSHILPNIMASVMVLATLYLAISVLIAATLSFLGVGVPPPHPELGGMTSGGRDVVATAWWVSTLPGSMIMLFVLAVNLVGDGIRDALDPNLRL